MKPSGDPVLRALLRAPIEDETPEERAILQAAQEEGGWLPSSGVTAEIAAHLDDFGCAAAGK